MKKSLALLLSLVLMFAAMPFALSASAADYVAEIAETGTQYTTVADAFNACKTGQTVKLLRDAVVVYLGGNVSHIMGRTIDLKGYTLTCKDERFISPGSGTGNWSVTVKNGILTNEGKNNFQSFAMVRANSTVTFEDLTIYDKAISRPSGYGFIGTITAATGVLNFKNCKIHESAVSTTQSYNVKGSTVNFYNTTVESYTPIFYTNSINTVYSGNFTALGDNTLASPTIASTSTVEKNELTNLVVKCNHNYVEGVCSYCGDIEAAEESPMTMKSGASIRLGDKNGIRFYTQIDTAKLAEFKDAGNTVELGTLIAPADLVEGELTHAIGADNYIDVAYKADEWHKGEEGVIAGSIVDIKPGNIGRAFIGIGYMKVTDAEGNAKYYYAKQDDNIRSLKSVAIAIRNENGEIYTSHKDQIDAWADVADWTK